ncbi:MAG: DUF3318 domain-containing protein [Cyanobacteria bacterium SBLK]|nr:DUF3318 domain-containing protein [Cyanobacteria bacterium SBLK]
MIPDVEIRRLKELMPASGRMYCQIVSKPQQAKVIELEFPLPWKRENRPIAINFDLWRQLKAAERDLLLLRSSVWLTGVQWFKPDIYQGLAAIGLVGTIAELTQGDVTGVVVAGGLSAIALRQLWRGFRSMKREIEVDEQALGLATRRGYSETEAAEHLLSGIESAAKLERRSSLTFNELIRTQNLRGFANLSAVRVPDRVREE